MGKKELAPISVCCHPIDAIPSADRQSRLRLLPYFPARQLNQPFRGTHIVAVYSQVLEAPSLPIFTDIGTCLDCAMDSHFQRSRSLAMDEDSDDQLLYSSSPSPTARLQARRRQPSGLPLGATSSPSTSLPTTTTTMISGRPSPLPTPTKSVPCLHNLNPPAPTSPPTPAPSPKPHQSTPNWVTAAEDEDAFLRETRSHFSGLGVSAKQFFLAEVLNLCDNQQLSFVNGFVSLRLKKDPFAILPNELCLRVCKLHFPRPPVLTLFAYRYLAL